MTIREMADANKAAGFYWFSADTMRFFACRLSADTFDGEGGKVYFVSSEKGPSGVRRYTVRVFDKRTADVDTVGEFQEHATAASAKRAARKAAAGVSEVAQ